MSRVRILNLPNDCTEKELREHFSKNVPASAPPLEITDVMIKRLKPEEGAVDRAVAPAGGRGGRTGGGSHGQTIASAAPRLGKIRMAFVGFRSSAAGHFVIQYYNGSYFRSSKIKVELAKGLNEVGVTLNMKKKLEKQQQQQQQQQQQESDSVPDDSQTAERSADGGPRSGKRPRPGASGEGAKSSGTTLTHSSDEARAQEGAEDGEGSGDPHARPDDRKKTRKELFIESRTKATEGPSWASEVLLPQTQDAATSLSSSSSPLAVGDGPSSRGVKGVHGDGSTGETRKADEEEEDDGLDDEARLLAALEKQQALGAVSDLDFLSGLGGGKAPHDTSGGGGAGEEEEEEGTGNASMKASKYGHDENESGEARRDAGEGNEESSPASGNATQRGPDGKRTDEKADATESPEDIARSSHRVRIGNIPYTATEDHVKQFAASLVGPVEEVHIPLTKDTRQSKGAAFVKFVDAEDAARALTLCRGAILMGRLLRVTAAEVDPHSKTAMEREARRATVAGGGGDGGGGLAGSSEFKLKRELERRGVNGDGAAAAGAKGQAAAGGGHVSWNTMYMNSSAAVDNVAQRLGVASTDLVSVQAKGAAVRAAIAEAYLTSEIQQVLSDEGVAFDVLESGGQSLLKTRSNTTILVKNLQLAGPDEAAELSKMFVRFGSLETSVFPSSGTFALFRFLHPQDARTAFTRLSYKLFKNAPLFLEWAPVGAIVEADSGETGAEATAAGGKEGGETADDKPQPRGATVVYTLFITNIPFTTTEDDFHAFLLDTCPRLAKAPDALIKRLVLQQQQGRAYLTLADAATFNYCLAKLNGKTCGTRVLACVASKQTATEVAAGAKPTQPATAAAAGVAVVPEETEVEWDKTASVVHGAANAAAAAASGANAARKVPHGSDPHKIIVKNVPFEATEADIRELFAAFSEVKSVRLPKKVNNFSHHRENNHRGFAFVEFLSEAEAARAMEVLKATHLYGRHLVLQYAKLDG